MLRLRTFGGLSIERVDGDLPATVAAGRRRLALLAVLAASDSPSTPRDKLLALFWPESDMGRARHSLDQTLYALKRDLGAEALVSGRDDLSLNAAEISSDVGDFRAALEKGDNAAAVELHSGAFLDGVYIPDAPELERWIADERASLERDLEDAMEAVAQDAVQRGDHRAAAQWWERLAARNPLRTRVIVALMSELAEAGDRDAALRRADVYLRLARDEGNPEPNPAVAALADKLRKAPVHRAQHPALGSQHLAEVGEPRAEGAATKAESRRPSRMRVAVIAAAALSLAGIWAIAAGARRNHAPLGWIVPADLDNRTGDSTFDRSLDAAFLAGLGQSQKISVFPRARMQETLGRMGRGRALPKIDEALAREIAQREGAGPVVAASIDRLDGSYVVAARVVDARTGTAILSERQVAKSRSDVIAAVDDVVRHLRTGLGESAEALAKHDRPLPLATTRSLDALRKFAEGLAVQRAGRYEAARALWLGAVADDSDFALAHAQLGASYYFTNDRVRGDAHFARALGLSDRLTDRERILVRAASESWRGNRESAIAIRRTLLDEYPDDPEAWGQIGYDYMRLGRTREAIDALRRQIARDSTSAAIHINLATALKQTGDFDAALRSYARAFALEPTYLTVANLNHEYGGALVLAGKLPAAQAAFDTMLTLGADERAQGERSIALLSMYEGKYSGAIEHLRRAVMLSQRPGRELSEARNRLYLAVAEREKGWSDSARAELGAARKFFVQNSFEPRFLMLLGKALVRDGQVSSAIPVLDSLRRRVKPDNPTDLSALRVLSAEVALAQGRADSAVHTLQLAATFDSSGTVMESLAHALAVRGDLAGAIRTYDRLVKARRQSFGTEADVVAMTSPRDVGLLYEQLGDTVRARAAYQEMVGRWPAGDADLVALRQSRDRLNRLRSRNDPLIR